MTLVDNQTALENMSKLAVNQGYVCVIEFQDNENHIHKILQSFLPQDDTEWKVEKENRNLTSGITVKTKDRLHQKFAIMDQQVVWYGNINFLNYGTSEESVMRIENMDIAGELMRSIS